MSSTSETGHARNVAYLTELIAAVKGFGVTYNPSKISIQVLELESLETLANSALHTVNSLLPDYSIATAARQVAFIPLNKLTTRTLNSLKATDASDQVVDNAKTIARKIKGTRKTPKKTEAEIAALAAEGIVIKEISASQMSYDSRISNLDKFIRLLASIPSYTPNETDLKVTTLQAFYDDLNLKNADVIKAATHLSNARIARDRVLYTPKTGLVDTGLDSKTYVKSVFGATSPQYRQISRLAFKAAKP